MLRNTEQFQPQNFLLNNYNTTTVAAPIISINTNKKMTRVLRKPRFCIYKSKAPLFLLQIVQFLFFLNLKFPASTLAIFCDCTARFKSDLFRNHTVGFSCHGSNIYHQQSSAASPLLFSLMSSLHSTMNSFVHKESFKYSVKTHCMSN